MVDSISRTTNFDFLIIGISDMFKPHFLHQELSALSEFPPIIDLSSFSQYLKPKIQNSNEIPKPQRCRPYFSNKNAGLPTGNQIVYDLPSIRHHVFWHSRSVIVKITSVAKRTQRNQYACMILCERAVMPLIPAKRFNKRSTTSGKSSLFCAT